jgi:hypothetical protein
MRRFALSLLVPFLLLADARAGSAFQYTRTLNGTVVDAAGEAVSDVELTLWVKSCQCSTCEDRDACNCCPPQTVAVPTERGGFVFSVPPGTYQLTARRGDQVLYDLEVSLLEDASFQVVVPR